MQHANIKEKLNKEILNEKWFKNPEYYQLMEEYHKNSAIAVEPMVKN